MYSQKKKLKKIIKKNKNKNKYKKTMQNQFSSQQSHPNIQMGMLPNQILIYQQQQNQFLQNQMQIPQILAQDNIKAKNIYLRNIIEKNQINDIIKFVQENKQTSLIQNGILMTLQKY